ncbi:glycoside hydrolase family 31 protein [Terriglobus saanensis]|uniref:Glycoside hydrolase family 31 n=1 Tax=Terriglobus saanensis (strain ATCC BAA-1853 / DSM 23119 / SP1PR4) TaxID=401053 RepID=E8V225_TERSS|nr:TIM-barrel domain-containing protein [Terriglobus saanensis]ADV84582.1 glycoside hydrolase family 31 [Terriglobus saanensis SP1PR4]
MRRTFAVLSLLVLAASTYATAQTAVPAVPSPAAKDAPVSGFVRQDADNLAFTVPGKVIGHGTDTGPIVLLHDFTFDGNPVATGKLHLRELSPGVLEITSVAYTVGEWEFRVHDTANYYGLGEHFNTLNHAHTIVKGASQDNGYAKGSSSYKPIPFFLSTTGYGLWVDTTAESTFDLNATDNGNVIVTAPSAKLRIILFTGPQFPVILNHFTELAGRAILPPYWAFAPWIGRDYVKDDTEVKADADRMRSLGLPASILLIDSPWATNYNTYTFNPKQFTDAPGMIKHLHEQGYKLVLWHTPWINTKTTTPGETGFADKIPPLAENYAEAAAKGFFIKQADGTPYVGRWWKGMGSLIDFTNPAAKQWWQDQVRQAIKAGADGFKDDDAEGNFVGGDGLQANVLFFDKSDPRMMRNRFAVLYNNAVEEVIQKDLKGNGVLFARSATVGNQNLPILWGGDNESSFSPENGLPTVLNAGLSAGLSGMSLWTSDIGGYLATAATPDVRLFQRWTEMSAFSPAMEVLNQKNLLPWDYGDAALATFRKFSLLHMSLFPYRFRAAQESAKTGMPLMRALVLNYQNDPHAREAKDEFLFGPDLLVAPVINEGTQRPVYLPDGDWVDFFTGAEVSGSKTVLAEAPLDTIPVYARAGSVIARIPEDVMTLVPSAESGNSTIHTLDDRRVYDLMPAFRGDATTQTDFEERTLTRENHAFKITGKEAKVTLRWRFGRPVSITVNGTAARATQTPEGPTIEFAHIGTTTVEWR